MKLGALRCHCRLVTSNAYGARFCNTFSVCAKLSRRPASTPLKQHYDVIVAVTSLPLQTHSMSHLCLNNSIDLSGLHAGT